MNESDLLVVVGASFSNHTGIAAYKPIVQVDDDADGDRPLPPGRRRRARRRRASTLRRCSTRRSATPTAVDQRADVAARWAIWRAEKARRVADDRGRGVVGAAVFAALSDALPDRRGRSPSTSATTPTPSAATSRVDGPAGADVGLPRLDRVRLPGRDGRLGRRPDRPVVAVTGDGGFGQYLAELTTAVKYGIPIKHVLLDNGVLGKISKEQLAGAVPGVADLAAQPRLRRVRRAVRRHRHPGAPRRRARRRAWRSSSPPTGPRCCTSTPTPSWCERCRPAWWSCWPWRPACRCCSAGAGCGCRARCWRSSPGSLLGPGGARAGSGRTRPSARSRCWACRSCCSWPAPRSTSAGSAAASAARRRLAWRSPWSGAAGVVARAGRARRRRRRRHRGGAAGDLARPGGAGAGRRGRARRGRSGGSRSPGRPRGRSPRSCCSRSGWPGATPRWRAGSCCWRCCSRGLAVIGWPSPGWGTRCG